MSHAILLRRLNGIPMKTEIRANGLKFHNLKRNRLLSGFLIWIHEDYLPGLLLYKIWLIFFFLNMEINILVKTGLIDLFDVV